MKEIKTITDHWEENKKGSLRKYYVVYLIAFGAIALIALISQLMIQNYLGKQSEDSYLINVSGKQRMLSQKITKNLSIYHFSKKKELKEKALEDLELWSLTHRSLKDGTLIHSKYNTPRIQSLYERLDLSFTAMADGVKGYFLNEDSVFFDKVLQNEQQYLSTMDEIVNLYDLNYQKKLNFLRRVELGLSVFLILVLIVEMFFVFLPLVNNLQRTFSKLVESENESTQMADNLNSINLKLKESSKELQDTNFALERAVLVVRTDLKGQIIYANDSYCRLTKYSFKELNSKPLFYNNSGEQESVIYSHINQERKRNGVWQGEVRDTASDGTEFWLDVTLFPIINEGGELYEYFVICSDITKRKEAEEELAYLNEQKFINQEKTQELNSKSIIEGQETERKRIAVEIHDGLGQMLTALKLSCEALDPKDKNQELIKSTMKTLLQDVIKETRRISSDLLPTVLNDFGLVAGVNELISVFAKSTELKIKLTNKSKLEERLPIEKEIALYRIVQESMNNSVKHSGSQDLVVDIMSDEEYFRIRIIDNGKGIKDVNELINVSNLDGGNGLRNMKERAKLIGANLYINSSLNKGTEIFVETPL